MEATILPLILIIDRLERVYLSASEVETILILRPLSILKSHLYYIYRCEYFGWK